MAIVRGRYRKPPLGAQLNRGHPLAQGLIRAWFALSGGGLVVSDHAVRDGTTVNVPGSWSWEASPDGPALSSTGADGSYLSGTLVPVLSRGLTFVARVRLDTAENLGRVMTFSTANPVNLGYHSANASAGDFRFYVTTSGGTVTALGSGSAQIGVWTTWAGTWDGADPGTVRLYKNGVELASGSTTGTLNAVPSGVHILGRSGAATDSIDAALAFALVYDRGLTAAEIKALTTDPYVLLAPSSVYAWAPVAAAGIGGQRSRMSLAIGLGL